MDNFQSTMFDLIGHGRPRRGVPTWANVYCFVQCAIINVQSTKLNL